MTGFVNAHTHLELTALANTIPEGLEFVPWIRALIAKRREFSEAQLLAGIEEGIRTMRDTGTVAVGDITATGLTVEPLLESGLAGVVFLEVLGRDPGPALERLAQTQARISDLRHREGRMRIGLSIHAPYSSCDELFVAAARWCSAERVPLSIHIAESAAEVDFVRDGSGPFAQMNRDFSPHLSPAHGSGLSPIGHLASLGVLDARPLLFHGVQADDADIALLRRFGCPMVHCPRSNLRLLCGRMPLERYLAQGVTVALGTDSLASSPSLDLREELVAAQELHGDRVTVEQLMQIATTNGWRALGLVEPPTS